MICYGWYVRIEIYTNGFSILVKFLSDKVIIIWYLLEVLEKDLRINTYQTVLACIVSTNKNILMITKNYYIYIYYWTKTTNIIILRTNHLRLGPNNLFSQNLRFLILYRLSKRVAYQNCASMPFNYININCFFWLTFRISH